jgi:TRAP-type C4-dicarboxylate transport system substrate-binding protein
MKKLVTISLFLAALSILILSGCGGPAQSPTSTAQPKPPVSSSVPSSAPATQAAQNVVELRFSHHNPPQGRTTVKFLNVWAKKAEDATKGKIKITMYPAESLAKSADNIQAVTGGVADMSWLNLGNWAGRFPLTEVIGLPFVGLTSGKVDGRSLSAAGINSHIIEQIYEETPEMQGEWATMKVLFIHTGDMTIPCTSKRQIHNLADVKGFKVRVTGKYPNLMWQTLGASPLQIPMPDVYDAAQKGVIDGFSLPWSAVVTSKLYEVFKYYSDFVSDQALFAVVMNKDKWNSLPKDVQDGIMSVSGIAGAEFAGESGWGADVKDEALAIIKQQNLDIQKVSLDPGEYDKWYALTAKPLWDKWVEEMNAKNLPGQKVLDKANSLIAKYK